MPRVVRPLRLMILLVLLSGCDTPFSAARARLLTAEKLHAISRHDDLDHMLYQGSDAEYDYFFRLELFNERSYKVRRGEIKGLKRVPLGGVVIDSKDRRIRTISK